MAGKGEKRGGSFECAATCYASALAAMREKARELGYALTLHGSMQRDLDLVGIPWINGAASPEALVEAICEVVGGHVINDTTAPEGDYTRRNPQPKPHGRLAWSIHLGGGLYIDLSIMPCTNITGLLRLIEGAAPVNAEQLKEYELAMTAAIPEIVRAVEKRQFLADEARQRQMEPEHPRQEATCPTAGP